MLDIITKKKPTLRGQMLTTIPNDILSNKSSNIQNPYLYGFLKALTETFATSNSINHRWIKSEAKYIIFGREKGIEDIFRSHETMRTRMIMETYPNIEDAEKTTEFMK